MLTFNSYHTAVHVENKIILFDTALNGSQLAKIKKCIPDMSLP